MALKPLYFHYGRVIKKKIMETFFAKSFARNLEKKWSKYHKLKYSITVNSCTSALHVAFLSLGCKVGDEVLVPSLTPVMTANAIIFTGATPIFVDVDEDTFLMDPKDLERKITKKSKVILLVHMYGGINDSKTFKKIANPPIIMK